MLEIPLAAASTAQNATASPIEIAHAYEKLLFYMIVAFSIFFLSKLVELVKDQLHYRKIEKIINSP